VYTEVDGQPTSWLGFTGGLRFDHHSLIENRLSPRAALFLAKPERYGAKLLYAEGFRNPSAFEKFFHDDVDFAQTVGLGAETIRSYEAVLWAKPRAGLSVRLSGFYWDARDIVEAQPPKMQTPQVMGKLQFQNVTRYVSRGVEAEASYRDSRGWYAFGGAALAQVGVQGETGPLAFGDVPNAPAVTASLGISTPKLFRVAHLSTEANLIGERPTRNPEPVPGAPPMTSPRSPAWLGWNVAVYAPNVKGFDITIGVRNLLGKRDLMPTPGDYDRTDTAQPDPDAPPIVVPRVPGEGRELYAKIGYSY
jgi:outer membrane receptor protein involved in Fe transport